MNEVGTTSSYRRGLLIKVLAHRFPAFSVSELRTLLIDDPDWVEINSQSCTREFPRSIVVLALRMEENVENSDNAGHHNERKRSSDNNAFAKFVPFSPPLGHDTESLEAKFGGDHEHGHKRLKSNSQVHLLETTTANTFSLSSHLPNKNIDTNETPNFPSPSTSIKHSANTGTSPQSIGSKSSRIGYVENDGKIGKTISDSCYWNHQNQCELETVMSMAAEELSKRPKTGGIYKAIVDQRECTVKRLKDLSNKEPTIDVGVEMADAVHLLKLMNLSSNEIDMAGQKGHKGAMLLLQAEILFKKGQELIVDCQNLLRDAL
ncbi:hypothetical protein VNO78_15672 [Psophocarpus tetragonolobus]|uniref:Uncharacterized protein n=1 Tax=Psophocarpus tetragonolobus TaxID=3891 RepID=A0AAN9XJZ8_PSOTE